MLLYNIESGIMQASYDEKTDCNILELLESHITAYQKLQNKTAKIFAEVADKIIKDRHNLILADLVKELRISKQEETEDTISFVVETKDSRYKCRLAIDLQTNSTAIRSKENGYSNDADRYLADVLISYLVPEEILDILEKRKSFDKEIKYDVRFKTDGNNVMSLKKNDKLISMEDWDNKLFILDIEEKNIFVKAYFKQILETLHIDLKTLLSILVVKRENVYNILKDKGEAKAFEYPLLEPYFNNILYEEKKKELAEDEKYFIAFADGIKKVDSVISVEYIRDEHIVKFTFKDKSVANVPESCVIKIKNSERHYRSDAELQLKQLKRVE